jgi:hypothetical protein
MRREIMPYVGEYQIQMVTELPFGLGEFTSSFSLADPLKMTPLECEFFLSLVHGNHERCTELISGMDEERYRGFLQGLADKGYINSKLARQALTTSTFSFVDW